MRTGDASEMIECGEMNALEALETAFELQSVIKLSFESLRPDDSSMRQLVSVGPATQGIAI